MIKNIKLLLRLPKRANNIRLKIALGMPDLCEYLISRLLIFNEKLNIYNNIIERAIDNIKGDIYITI